MDYPLPNFDASDAASAIAKAADIAIILDADGVVVDVSVNAPELAKLDVKRWIGKPFAEFVTTESVPKIDTLMAEDLSGLRRWRQINHPFGGENDLPVEYAVIHVAADQSRIIAGRELIGIANLQQRLIAAQQSMEREYARVRSAEARYRILFQMTTEAVVIVDAVTERIVDANPAAITLLDLKPARINAAEFTSLVDGADAPTVEALLAKVRATGGSDAVDVRGAGGRNLSLIASFFSQGGKSLFLLRVADADATDSAARTQSRVAEVIDQMPEGFVVCDTAGTVLSANAAFVELTQTARVEQMRGEPISRWIGRTGVDASVLLSALTKREAVQRFSTIIRGEHGGFDLVEISGVMVKPINGEPCCGLAVRIVRPEQPRTTAGLERSVEQLTELVGSVPLKDLVREATDLIERMCIEAALRLTEDNRASAAEILGVSRQSLYNKMRRFDLLAPGLDPER
ncbi:transcriptional regulator PpsR [Acuticoccus kandeliae]|uniref:transcriptional regulator PpsR n=1 Tax=Acuticoccus kandeliae TaxID=2073160 RepID=UPI000D3E871D|nr:transcriptional regulator PpsR [Acuticoccus kandeliae]